MKNIENVNRIGVIGPGGVRCFCCASATVREKQALIRPARRKAKRRAIREGVEDWHEAKADKEGE